VSPSRRGEDVVEELSARGFMAQTIRRNRQQKKTHGRMKSYTLDA